MQRLSVRQGAGNGTQSTQAVRGRLAGLTMVVLHVFVGDSRQQPHPAAEPSWMVVTVLLLVH